MDPQVLEVPGLQWGPHVEWNSSRTLTVPVRPLTETPKREGHRYSNCKRHSGPRALGKGSGRRPHRARAHVCLWERHCPRGRCHRSRGCSFWGPASGRVRNAAGGHHSASPRVSLRPTTSGATPVKTHFLRPAGSAVQPSNSSLLVPNVVPGE